MQDQDRKEEENQLMCLAQYDKARHEICITCRKADNKTLAHIEGR